MALWFDSWELPMAAPLNAAVTFRMSKVVFGK